MAATQISRATWTDGSGGTVINNATKNTDIYDPIDAMFANDVTFGGTIAAEGVGNHSFSGGGTGGNTIVIRNSSGGTGNFSSLELGNDTDADLGRLECYSGSFTETGAAKQDGIALRSVQDGGVSIAAEHASGDVRIYARGTSTLVTYDGEDFTAEGGNRGSNHLVGTLDDSIDTTSAGNAADTNWATLYSYTIPANVLNETGRILRGTFLFQTTADQKDIEMYLGGTGGDQISVQTNGTNADNAILEIYIIRTGSNTQEVFVNHNDGVGALTQKTSATQTDSSSMELLIRAKSDTSTANVAQVHWGFVEILR